MHVYVYVYIYIYIYAYVYIYIYIYQISILGNIRSQIMRFTLLLFVFSERACLLRAI